MSRGNHPFHHWALRMTAAVLVALLSLMVVGCGSRAGHSESVMVEVVPPETPVEVAGPVAVTVDAEGMASVIAPSGSRVTVSRGRAEQPEPPKGAAASRASRADAWSDTGDAGKLPVRIGGVTFWVGLALIISGMALFAAKRAGMAAVIAPGPTGLLLRAAAVAPQGSGIGLMVIGGGVMILPWFLDQWDGWIVPIGLGIAGLFLAKHVWNIWGEIHASRNLP